MNDTLKQNFLKQLEVNTQIIINKFNSLNISVENTDYRGFITSIFDVSYLTNSGDIRNIDIFVNTIDENMKNKYFCVSLNDKSIGAGLYCSPKNKYGFSSLSSSWQTKSFDSLKTKELFILSSKNISHGTPIDFMVEIDTILEPLYKLFWRDEKFLINYYKNKNINARKKVSDNQTDEELKHFTPIFKHSDYFIFNQNNEFIIKLP